MPKLKQAFETIESHLKDLEQEVPITSETIGSWTVFSSQLQALSAALARQVMTCAGTAEGDAA